MTDNRITSELLQPSVQVTLAALLDALIPANDEYATPSGGDEAILQDIVQTFRASANQLIREGLIQLRDLSLERHEEEFEKTDEEQRVALFMEMRNRNGEFYRTLSSVLVQCYYRNDDVMRSLSMEPRPPFPIGHEVPKGDFNLLEPVRARGKLWRDA